MVRTLLSVTMLLCLLLNARAASASTLVRCHAGNDGIVHCTTTQYPIHHHHHAVFTPVRKVVR